MKREVEALRKRLSPLEDKLLSERTTDEKDEIRRLSKEREQLREKERQLREEKKLLLEEKIQLLKKEEQSHAGTVKKAKIADAQGAVACTMGVCRSWFPVSSDSPS